MNGRTTALRRSWGLLCLAMYLAIVIERVLVAPFIGFPDNSDFRKVLGRLSMGWAGGVPGTSIPHLDYFVSDYEVADKWKFDDRLPSSEVILAWIARQAAHLVTHTSQFDIRYFGALNIALAGGAFAAALGFLRTQAWWAGIAIPPLFILIFSDPLYTTYFNSFYMDATSIASLLWFIAAACLLSKFPVRAAYAITMAIAGLFFATSKPQHSPLAIPAAMLALWLAYSATSRPARWISAAGGIGMLLSVPFMVGATPGYRAALTYDLIFLKLTKVSPDPAVTLGELGLPPEDVKRIGTNAFMPEAYTTTRQAKAAFERKVPYARMLRYYLTHPWQALKMMDRDLRNNTSRLRPIFGNYREQDGFPPWEQAHGFDWWSSHRGQLASWFPYHLPAFYALILGLCAIGSVRRSCVLPILLALWVIGAMAFGIASLGDGMDTERHLILFHLCTDLLIVLATGIGLTGLQNAWERRA